MNLMSNNLGSFD